MITPLILLLMVIAINSCSFEQDVPLEKQCTIDKDCVPAACCHAKDTVNKNFAPDCDGAICTMNCEPNTLDCGQGEVKCISNMCDVTLTNPVE